MAALDRLDDLRSSRWASSRGHFPSAAGVAMPRAASTSTRSPRRSPSGSARRATSGTWLAASDRAPRVRDRRVREPRTSGARTSSSIRRTSTPEIMARAVLASAAITASSSPSCRRRSRPTAAGCATSHSSTQPATSIVAAIVAFRYVATYPASNPAPLERTRERLERFRAVPPVRVLLAEVRLAQERAARGEPAHYGELVVRLMRVAFARNAIVDERLATERETSVRGSGSYARTSHGPPYAAAPLWRRKRLRSELDTLFEGARFPFRHDRHVPTVIVRGTAGSASLDPTFRGDTPGPRTQTGPHRSRLRTHGPRPPRCRVLKPVTRRFRTAA